MSALGLAVSGLVISEKYAAELVPQTGFPKLTSTEFRLNKEALFNKRIHSANKRYFVDVPFIVKN
jgi:hypothetical protein